MLMGLAGALYVSFIGFCQSVDFLPISHLSDLGHGDCSVAAATTRVFCSGRW